MVIVFCRLRLLDFPFRFEVESCFVGESEVDYPAIKKSLSENHSRNSSFELFDDSKWIILPSRAFRESQQKLFL